MTEAQIQHTQKEYSRIAGEQVEIEIINSTLYAFGSEMATLRLFRKMPSKNQGYSENTGKFYFSVDMSCSR